METLFFIILLSAIVGLAVAARERPDLKLTEAAVLTVGSFALIFSGVTAIKWALALFSLARAYTRLESWWKTEINPDLATE